MNNLQIKLMYREAIGRLHDANILSQRIDRASDSNYLLELLALELLLKALALIHCGRFNENHNYQQIFESLPQCVRRRVVEEAAHRSNTPLSPRRVQELLILYKNNFVRMRYPFEEYLRMSESEYIEYGNLWVELDSPTAEAEFQYHPNELYGLTVAIRGEVEKVLANK